MSEKVKIKIARNVVHLPAIALRGLVVFPNNVVHFEVGRTKSIAAIEAAMHNNSSVFLVAQREMDVEEPALRDLYGYGVIAEIKQVLRVSEDIVKVLVEGKTRARLLELDGEDKYLQATVRPVPVRGIAADKRTQVEALVRSLKDCFEEYLSYSPQISKDVVYNIISSDSPLYLSEYMPANLLLKYEDKQVILNESTLLGRLEKLLTLLQSRRAVWKEGGELFKRKAHAVDSFRLCVRFFSAHYNQQQCDDQKDSDGNPFRCLHLRRGKIVSDQNREHTGKNQKQCISVGKSILKRTKQRKCCAITFLITFISNVLFCKGHTN